MGYVRYLFVGKKGYNNKKQSDFVLLMLVKRKRKSEKINKEIFGQTRVIQSVILCKKFYSKKILCGCWRGGG